MTSYTKQKSKTPSKGLWKFFIQTAGSLGVFFLVITIFQSTSPSSLKWQQFLRTSFTVDADLAPVMQFFDGISVDSLPEEEAVRVNAASAPVLEAMAVPVTGTVMNEYGWDETQISAAFQDGLRIATAPEESIRAAYQGTVTDIQEQNGTYQIELSHTNGLVTIYGQCAQCSVRLHEPVEKGQEIGKTGQQEQEESNFYFAAKYLGEPIDPLELL